MRELTRRAVAATALCVAAGTGVVATAEVAGADPIAYAVADGPEGGACQFGTIDLATGAFSPVGTPSGDLCVFDLTVAPDGTVYGIFLDAEPPSPGSPWFLQTIDRATGAVTSSERIGVDGGTDGGEGGGVAFDPAGTLFAEYVPDDVGLPGDCAEADAFCLATVDPANPGAAAVIGPAPFQTQLESLTITCAGDFFVTQGPEGGPGEIDAEAAGDGGWGPQPQVINNADLARVDPATGATSVIGAYGQVITGHDVDPAGTLWGVGFIVGGPPSVFTIDTATGVATPGAQITNANAGLLAIAIDHPCDVPPPPPPPQPPPPLVPIEPTFTG